MRNTPTTFTVADYCLLMERKEILVNKDYQRSEKVWPIHARSFLIETILLNFPIPKLYLYQVTDLKSRRTIKHIVDGQQRSYTILDFYHDKFALSRTSEIEAVRGRTFSQLPEEFQQKFMDYPISADLFTSASEEEIREVFRRINSYTVPLNSEEKRHSTWQGEFKWFIYRLTKQYDQTFVNIGVFKDRQLVRMADAKLFTEIVNALLKGIKTTTAYNLDKLYKDFDDDFPYGKNMSNKISDAMKQVINWPEIHNSSLMKPHIFYSLLLAIIHTANPVDTLLVKYEPELPRKILRVDSIANLTALAQALEEPETAPKKFKEFILASAKTTNDEQRRSVIFKWLCKAIEFEKI